MKALERNLVPHVCSDNTEFIRPTARLVRHGR